MQEHDTAYKKVIRAFGSLDIMVHNAGRYVPNTNTTIILLSRLINQFQYCLTITFEDFCDKTGLTPLKSSAAPEQADPPSIMLGHVYRPKPFCHPRFDATLETHKPSPTPLPPPFHIISYYRLNPTTHPLLRVIICPDLLAPRQSSQPGVSNRLTPSGP